LVLLALTTSHHRPWLRRDSFPAMTARKLDRPRRRAERGNELSRGSLVRSAPPCYSSLTVSL
jgi:hypothetical protein